MEIKAATVVLLGWLDHAVIITDFQSMLCKINIGMLHREWTNLLADFQTAGLIWVYCLGHMQELIVISRPTSWLESPHIECAENGHVRHLKGCYEQNVWQGRDGMSEYPLHSQNEETESEAW